MFATSHDYHNGIGRHTRQQAWDRWSLEQGDKLIAATRKDFARGRVSRIAAADLLRAAGISEPEISEAFA